MSRILLLPSLERHLVGREQRQAAPGQELRAEQRDRRRRDAAARALAAERGDGSRVGEEEAGLLPDLREQLVEIVRRRRPAARLDPLRGVDVVQQAVLLVVDQLALLALLDRSRWSSRSCSPIWL